MFKNTRKLHKYHIQKFTQFRPWYLSSKMNIIKFIRGTWWGASPEASLILYKTFVRSIIDSGCFIYFPTQTSQIQKIEKIKFLAIRLCLGFRISTPTNILLSESKLPFLQNRAEFLCQCYINKIKSNTGLPIYLQTHSKLFPKLKQTKKSTSRIEAKTNRTLLRKPYCPEQYYFHE